MTATWRSVWTWFAARPAPSYSRMVSTMSSMNRWTSGERISLGGIGSATWRRMGWPRRATFRIAMTSSILARALLRLDPPHLPHALGEALGVGLVLPHIKSGKLRPLAGWGAARVAALPDVPTFKELGYPGAEFYIWAGLFAPRDTPPPALAKLRGSVRAAVGDPDFRAAMDKLETPVAFKQGEEFRKFFEADAKRLAEGVRQVGRVQTQ